MHDPRVGRFFAIDPLFRKYPHNSPYAFSENRVIDAIEFEGLERISYFVNDRLIHKGFGKIMKLTYLSVMGQIKSEFAQNNRGVDIYIIPLKLNNNVNGRTFEFGFSDDINEKTMAYSDGSNERWLLGDLLSQSQIEILKRDSPRKKILIVGINESRVDMAEHDDQILKENVETIAHEIELHCIDLKDGKDDVNTNEEHKTGYDLDEPSRFSPDYNVIKPKSTMGKLKAKIEKAYDDLKKNSVKDDKKIKPKNKKR
jgi:hypothetical protein